ncbi:putative MFS transporter [Cryphonectria parasitica EP155]|uniref:MFS transporter n=1 Tax=Cryphonectria parasitica (strain ATCC 38755 / EP155) TaxID=660469 RepID=A0A9P4XTY8_CRYP1|nr:putative MFS transporter [Cryphonectria parasitica EP155]KAF3760964.1 putative MFS transporter [Cryphonectria parasitica EP155]
MAVTEPTTTRPHLAHSHAREEDVPGTVNLRAREGDDTGYGQALFPVPAEDPNDPLQWGNLKKTMILVVCALYSFFGNSSLLGPSVYISIFAEEFGISANTASGLISYANLAFGFGSLLLVPLYHKFGRRPVMLFSLLCYCAGLIGASQANSYGGLMAARIIHAFGSGVCEALPVQLVNDIFFLHERGQRIGYYTVALCFGSTGPMFAGYMLNGGYSWRLFFYVEFAFACALFILAFFIVEETTYHRKLPVDVVDTPDTTDKPAVAHVDTELNLPKRKTFTQQLKFWGVYERDSDFFLMMARSFTYFLVPHVFWVVATYGIYIGLGALTFNYITPLKVTAPPYNWSELNSGLISVATFIGYGAAIPFTTSSDRLAAHLTKKNNMIREAEMRLGVCLPAMLIAPAGLIVFGFTAQKDLHWVGYFAGVIMTQFSSYFYFTFVLSYALDSYTANTSEMLIAMNLGKQAISFGMGIDILEWVEENGYAVMIAGVFCGVLLVNNLALIPFMLYGKGIREFMAKTWLARIHKDSVREVMTV